jgi:flagellar basal body rod protein FlgC
MYETLQEVKNSQALADKTVRDSMNSVLSIAMSALRACGMKLTSAASNIASMDVEGHMPSDVTMKESPNGGVIPEVVCQDEGAYTVDLSKEMVDLIVAANAVKANIAVMKNEDEVMKSVIDIKA